MIRTPPTKVSPDIHPLFPTHMQPKRHFSSRLPFSLPVHLYLIGGFVLLNAGVGILFHSSLHLICLSEFLVLGISSFLFWSVNARLIKQAALKWNYLERNHHLWTHGGLGFSVSLLNILLGQGLIIFCMVYLYRCPISPSFDWVNALLTNNVGINLLCYFALSSYFLHRDLPTKAPPSSPQATGTLPSDSFVLFSHGRQQLIWFKEVRYIQTSNNCIVIHTSTQKHVTYQSLKQFLLKHPYPFFQRTHRSFAVNTQWINSIQKNKNGDGWIHLKGGNRIKLSRNYPITLSSPSTYHIKLD
ncbi:MAG: LytTR family DNA-binding domain-containing protein [Bacteroidota bacterium]